MSGLNHQNNQSVILDLAEDTVIFDTVSPVFVEIASKSLAELPGAVAALNAFIQKLNDLTRWLVSELLELFTSFGTETIIPTHV